MPKLKTHKGAAARFRTTGTGKLLRMKRHSSHLRRTKPKAVRRLYSGTLPVNEGQRRRLVQLVPSLSR
jgi:large subunit ribosomal protein L35